MTTFHLKQSITGCLRNNPVGTIDFIEDSEGNLLSDAEARIELNKLLAMGRTVMPVGDGCKDFDVFGGGCAGHEPLVGSALCHAMLKRGDKAVMCKANNSNHMTIITGYKEAKAGGWVFHSNRHTRHYDVVPINNQGEPLTAKEVGL